MIQIYVTCGSWRLIGKDWQFSVDRDKYARVLSLESTTTIEVLKDMVSEEYKIDLNKVELQFSYLPSNLIIDSESPPVLGNTDRQLKIFISSSKGTTMLKLCLCLQPRYNEEHSKNKDSQHESTDGATDASENLKDLKNKGKGKLYDDDVNRDDSLISVNIEEESLNHWVADPLNNKQHFESKEALKASVEICAMKYNFNYKVTKSDTRLWCIRCKENACNWSLRAECFAGSTYFKINKNVTRHTCAPSSKSKFGRIPSAKTFGELIKHKYEGVKEGPKPNDIRSFMRTEHSCEISYSQAWESREYAINNVRGIPEKSFGKIPKYLYMLQQVNPGTHTSYETDCDTRFKYFFISFGQSIRGFYKAMCKVIVVDGTFLKSKYKGVLLVATAVDGNSNLYPIAFGIVDSENDNSWEWFFEQLKVVVADDKNLSFVSDRHFSIGKSIKRIYPLASHGICIHHLLNNVVTYYKAKGLASLVAKASKAYRIVEFEKLFNQICKSSTLVGKYLEEAGIKKWARCHFLGFMYDIRTTNPAESINSVLRLQREYPVIPLVESIREMLTRWFHERKSLSLKHKSPLTSDIEKKIARRIEKAKRFIVSPVSSNIFQVKGDIFDCVVDLSKKACTCGKFDIIKLPCRHAIKAAFYKGIEIHTLTDEVYSTISWRTAYAESINPIDIPEDAWHVPLDVDCAKVIPPETRRRIGRPSKRRHETVEDKIRSSQGTQGSKKLHKCSRSGTEGPKRSTCDKPI